MWESSCTDVMRELITPDFKDQWALFTKQHAVAWRAAHPSWKKNRIEQSAPSVPAMKKLLTHNAFDLWLACRLRCSQFKPEIDVSKLWDTKSSIYDVQVHRAIPRETFKWLNRQASFASRLRATATYADEDDEDDEDDEGEEGEESEESDEESDEEQQQE